MKDKQPYKYQIIDIWNFYHKDESKNEERLNEEHLYDAASDSFEEILNKAKNSTCRNVQYIVKVISRVEPKLPVLEKEIIDI